MEKDIYSQSRRMYIYEAALEYMTELLVSSTYLAKVSSSLGMTASQIGILSSFVSLAEGGTLAALLLVRKTPVKRWVVPLSVLNQLAFATLYFIPLFSGKVRAFAWLFAAMLLLGHVLARISKPAKINWLMSLVPDGRRGVFSANKEIVSLLIGMAFTAAMSRIIDGYEAVGNLNKAYIFIGVTILLLTLLHTLSLIFAKEKTVPEDDKPEKHSVLGMLSDKNICAVLAIYVLWGVVSSISRPFYGSYEIDELGFSMTFASLLVILGSFARMLFSRPMGKLGDKKGFLTMLASGLLLETASLVTAAFSTPQNGRILFTASMILHYTAMAGINSGLVNSIFDYAKPAARTGAIALADFLSGVFGFGVTAAVSPAVNAIQESGNTVLGHSIFAQQLLSAVAAVCCMGMIVFILIMKKKLNRPAIR